MYSVVIADDEQGIHSVLKNLIQWEKHELMLYKECYNGDELIEAIDNAVVDIVITDMQMPGLCGVDILKKLSTDYKDLAVLVISGYDDFKYTRQAIVSNAIDYILKPVDEEELDSAINNAIKKVKNNRMKYLENDDDDFLTSPILVKYFREIQEKEQNVEDIVKQSLAYQVKKYLDNNFQNVITLSDLEGKFLVSKDKLSHLFKKLYGVSILNYIDHLKVRRANTMLAKGKSVKEVTYALGYYDESHFNRKYKSIMNISPSNFSL